jgi:hypothetical protein
MFDPQGEPVLQFRKSRGTGEPWSLNPNPRLPVRRSAAASWNEELRRNCRASNTHTLDGEYLDSLEGYDARSQPSAEHFRHTTVPLTFATGTRAPALFKGLSVFEFTRWISTDASAGAAHLR